MNFGPAVEPKTSMRTHPLPLCLSILMLASPQAQAQPAPQESASRCALDEATLVQQMEVARATGRMLQRRQLTDQLVVLQSRCGTLAPVPSREASIERLQREISELRKELDRAETELRTL
ncbi:MAG: DUF1090 family protein, partial [Pseudomonadota bacterium]